MFNTICGERQSADWAAVPQIEAYLDKDTLDKIKI